MTTANPAAGGLNPKRAVPIILFTFVFSLIVDNGFKFMTDSMGEALNLTLNEVSLQASLAGVIIGIGAVVYAALADVVSIRKLMLVGIALTLVGSVIGYVGQNMWSMVLIGRVVQTTGLAAAETLYVIYVTKHLSEQEQKTYLGFSTAAFQGATLFGALTSGYIATHISWTAMFLIPLILIVAVPVILKTVPEEESLEAGHVDWVGLLLIAVLATSAIMFMQAFNFLWLIPLVVGIALFVAHIKRGARPLVSPEFFQNRAYVTALILVFVVYSVQLGYLVLFPAMAREVHGLSADTASLLLIPGYTGAVLVGILSGKIGQFLPSRPAIFTALASVIVALLMLAFFMELGPWVFVVSSLLFACGFALLYAPLVATAIGDIPPAKSGIAIGFYNLTINVAVPLGIAYSAKLVDLNLATPGFLPANAGSYPVVMLILALIAAAGTALYAVLTARMQRPAQTISSTI
ncbi:MFS transporter [Corynebacterium sp. TA-R-1]|uniref:MFS transporter n=1 Tax=Corynebacterium stercoris TaxID=2943490 RepID=A0ABT1FYZ3_9CORY|nr:MFS transporter [Corynebacterium stercoris]MCP1386936.1 MFS transporter [Corynebacterium stercoris]